MAIAWELWRPQRDVWALCLAGMVLASALVLALPAGTIDPMEAAIQYSLLAIAWLVVNALIVFTYTTGETDLAAGPSNFPARMFTLPVRTHALVGWPMLYGTVVMALLWVVPAGLARGLLGITVPLAWPALGLAAFLAWFQAVAWCPFGLPWARVGVAVVLLSALVAVPQLALAFQVPDEFLVAVFTMLLPAAYVTAVAGVARARRGDNAGWWPARKAVAAAKAPPPRDRPFSSAMRAQLWYEWRCHGLDLPFTVAMVLVLFVGGLWFGKTYEAAFQELEKEGLPPQLRVAFLGLLALVPFLAAVAGVHLGNTGTKGLAQKTFILPAFLAVRPLPERGLVAAKLQAAVLITLVCWGLILVVVPLALLATGTWRGAVGWILDWLGEQTPLQAGTFAVAAIVVLIGGTWSSMAGTLFLGLLGRAWIVYTTGVAGALFFIPVLVFANWILKHPEYYTALASILSWVVLGVVGLKVLVGTWTVRAVSRGGAIPDGTVARILGTWTLMAAGLFGLLRLLIPPELISWSGLAGGVILLVPINRLLAAPLALAWNRHR
jgi:hypothetical protein